MTTDPRSSLSPLPPGSVIGILGGGQLGRMLASAAAKLGLKTHIFAPEDTPPAAETSGMLTSGSFDDEAALRRFAGSCDVVTLEFENVPVAALNLIEEAGTPCRPGRKALDVSQDRLAEKRFMKELGIETAPFMPVASEAALGVAMEVAGLPAILKTRRFGYDGKGQVVIHDADEIAEGYASLAGAPAILEGFVAFEREISVILARDTVGNSISYPPSENQHRDGILRRSAMPANVSGAIAEDAATIAAKIADALDYTGVLAVEFFVEKSGLLRVNEIAPRVHNSGHWTVEACLVSQFENHIRAVAGWSLGETRPHSACEMENLIGEDAAGWQTHVAAANTALTLYGKSEARQGRKMGHITRLTGPYSSA